MSLHATAFADGGNRGSPGPHACAAVLKIEGDLPRSRVRYLGPTGTNNLAEVQGLIMAMRIAAECDVTHLKIRLDSKLIVEQALGNWQIKNKRLKVLHASARQIALECFEQVEICHIPREENKEADALCTACLDKITGRFRRS